MNLLKGLPEERLTPEDEARLVGSNREEDRNTLILHNMREALPYGIVCCRNKIAPDVIFSLCFEAMSKAARAFKPGRGTRFFSYAKVWIRGEICSEWGRKDVVRSSSLHETGVPEYSTSAPLPESNPNEDEPAPLEPDYVDPEFQQIDAKEWWAIVNPLLRTVLGDRERTILQLYYDGGFSFGNISGMLVPAVSRAAIQDMHARAIKKLRAAVQKSALLRG